MLAAATVTLALLLLVGAEFPRFGIILLPFLAIFSGVALQYIFKDWAIFRNTPIFICVLLIISSQNLLRIIKYTRLTLAPDTKVAAQKWIEENVAANKVIVNEGYISPTGMPVLGVHLYPETSVVQMQIDKSPGRGERMMWDIFQHQAVSHQRFNIIPAHLLNEYWDNANGELTEVDPQKWQESADYLVINDWVRPHLFDGEVAKLESFGNWELTAKFQGYPMLKFDPHNWRYDWQAIDQVKFFQPEIMFGPRVIVYKNTLSKKSQP